MKQTCEMDLKNKSLFMLFGTVHILGYYRQEYVPYGTVFVSGKIERSKEEEGGGDEGEVVEKARGRRRRYTGWFITSCQAVLERYCSGDSDITVTVTMVIVEIVMLPWLL